MPELVGPGTIAGGVSIYIYIVRAHIHSHARTYALTHSCWLRLFRAHHAQSGGAKVVSKSVHATVFFHQTLPSIS